MPSSSPTLLALDVGDRRIGVAIAHSGVTIASPLLTIQVDGHEHEQVISLAQQYAVQAIVIGLPRNMSGEETLQSASVRNFAKMLQEKGLETVFQDESLTSVAATTALDNSKKAYQRGDVDAVAASLILRDYLEAHYG